MQCLSAPTRDEINKAHCRFTSFEVSTLVKGESYAGRYALSQMESGTAAGAEGGNAGSRFRSRA